MTSGLEPDFLQSLADRARDARERHGTRTAPGSHRAALRDLETAREGLASCMSRQQWPQKRTPNTIAMAGIAHAGSGGGRSNRYATRADTGATAGLKASGFFGSGGGSPWSESEEDYPCLLSSAPSESD